VPHARRLARRCCSVWGDRSRCCCYRTWVPTSGSI